MSFLGDVWNFDKFATKDLFKNIAAEPERLLIGAVDPASTALWNAVLGKDYEPWVDQLGGPYGGSTFSAFGNNNGGVYGRAQDQGINTNAGKTAHDTAHVAAAVFGGQGLAGAGGGGAGGGAGGGSGFAAGGSEVPIGGMTSTEAAAYQAAGAQQGSMLGTLGKIGGAAAAAQAGGGGGGGGMMGSQIMPAAGSPATAQSGSPLDQRNRGMKGYGRRPYSYRGSIVWV